MGCEGCNDKTTIYTPGPHAPKNIGGVIATKAIPLSEEERTRIINEKRQHLEDGLLSLRKAGYPVDFCADCGRVRIITEEWDVSEIDGKLTFLVEGLDISKHILNAMTSLGSGDFPRRVTVTMWTPVKKNEE